jgi:K+ transporter
MATTEGTDARILAAAFALSAVVLPLVGLAVLPDAPFEMTASTMIPLLLAAVGFLAMMLVVDPVLTPKRVRSRTDVHIWLSRIFMYRLPAIEVPVLAALLIAVAEQERSVLLIGAFGSLVLAAVWWPGDQFFNAMRRRLQPLSADHLIDDLMKTSKGRLFLKTR